MGPRQRERLWGKLESGERLHVNEARLAGLRPGLSSWREVQARLETPHLIGPHLRALSGPEAGLGQTWKEGGARREAGRPERGACVTLRRVTCDAGGHGGKRATQRRQLPSATPQRLEPSRGRHPQRLEELLAVGGQGEGSAESLSRGGG